MKSLTKTIILITILVLCLSNLFGIPVSIEKAEKVAKNWYLERCNKDTIPQFDIEETFTESRSSGVVYYIFNFNLSGYIIVAADDISIPVLGYSYSHNYETTNHPPAFDELLNWYALQIDSARVDSLTPLQETTELWDRLSVNPEDFVPESVPMNVEPLLTTEWDQDWPYNELCPDDPVGPGGHAYAGCVATAMGQVMKYWNHPYQGTDSHGYYHPDYGYLFVDFGATTYGWADMPNSISSSNTAVATLLYHCGVGVEMDYGPYSSGTYTSDAVYAFETYFSYDNNAIFRNKSNYSSSVWEGMLREELDNGRPLVYRGQSSGSGGHAFNLDGYEGTNHFHINWGWSGWYNGYYYLNDLTPGSFNYTYLQGAVFGIEPEQKVHNRTQDTWYNKIQYAINDADDGDILIAEPRTYLENIHFDGKNITLASLFLTTQDSSYISQTIIDGSLEYESVVTFASGEDGTAALTGFTIQNGSGTLSGVRWGGGVYCFESSPTIQYNIIRNNSADFGGGICSKSDPSPNIQYNTIKNNYASFGGGICATSNSFPTIQNNKIRDNIAFQDGGGINCRFSGDAVIAENIISNNQAVDDYGSGYGGGIACYYASPIIKNNTIYNNQAAPESGGGIDFDGSYSDVKNCILWNNSPEEIYVYSGYPSITYSDIQGGWGGTGNIDLDPLFVDAENEDYSLFQDSPCIDTGDPNSEPDPDGTCADMGYFSAKLEKHSLSAERVNWTSLPRLNPHNADAYDIFEELILDGSLEEVVYYGPYRLWYDGVFWYNDIGDLKTVHGYRIKMIEPDTLSAYGYKTDPDTTRITLYPGALPNPPKWNWIGYFLEEDMSITDAFPHEVYSKIASIKSDNWCIYRPIDSDYWKSGRNEIPVKGRAGALKYAHSYGVRLGNTVEDTLCFVWGQEITEEVVDFVKAPTEYFAYEAKADYMPIFVDSTEALNGIEEIGVFLEDECIGASKTEDGFPLFIHSYTEDEPFRWREYDELTFQVVTYGKNETRGIQVFVYNELQDAFVQEPVILDNNSYAVVRLGSGEEAELPREFTLYQNYPNPICNSTTISFIPSPGVEKSVMKIYNLRGQLVKTLVPMTNDQSPMTNVVWSGKGENGKRLGNGIYFYKLISGDKSAVKKMVLLR